MAIGLLLRVERGVERGAEQRALVLGLGLDTFMLMMVCRCFEGGKVYFHTHHDFSLIIITSSIKRRGRSPRSHYLLWTLVMSYESLLVEYLILSKGRNLNE